MSYRKTKLIQERNILLERKYILEQAPPPAPAPVGAPPAVPAPIPTTGETTPSVPTIPTGQDVNNTKKMSESDIKKAPHCSKKGFKIDTAKYEKKEEKINGVTYIYYLNEKKDMILCRDKPN